MVAETATEIIGNGWREAACATLSRQIVIDVKGSEQLAKRIPAEAEVPTVHETHAFSSVLWWAGVVFILYVLSVGPVAKLAFEEKIPMKALETIYAPMVWLCETPIGHKVVQPCLVWYGQTIWRWGLPVK